MHNSPAHLHANRQMSPNFAAVAIDLWPTNGRVHSHLVRDLRNVCDVFIQLRDCGLVQLGVYAKARIFYFRPRLILLHHTADPESLGRQMPYFVAFGSEVKIRF